MGEKGRGKRRKWVREKGRKRSAGRRGKERRSGRKRDK